MTIEELVKYYPRLYHMAESGTWDSIRRHGLLSTNALLELFDITGDLRRQLSSEHRRECVFINHPKHGWAVIRDQKPMRESFLRDRLDDGLTPAQWYETLNQRVFFWVNPVRLNRLLGARPYRRKQHCVLTLNTADLLRDHADQVTLCPINSGCTLFNAPRRGLTTFQRIGDYPFDRWRAQRGKREAVVEFVVDHAVRNAADYVLRVEERKADQLISTVFERQ